ncbi:MAG: FlgD immunoglobulin-like domain containing protein [bacterium]
MIHPSVTTNRLATALLLLGGMLLRASYGQENAAAHAIVDLVADSLYLRTEPHNGGTLVNVPVPGQQYFIHIAFRNAGSTPTGPFRWNININGVFECGATLAAGANTSWVRSCSTPWIAVPGTSTLFTGQLDAANVVQEPDKNNNTIHRTIAVPIPPANDLIADRVYLRTGQNSGDEVNSPVAGRQYFIHVDLRSTFATGLTVPVEFRLNRNVQCTVSLSVGANSKDTTFCTTAITWPATLRDTISARLDHTSTIAEVNENNNFVQRTFGNADLVPDRVFLRTARANGGVEVTDALVGQPYFLHFEWRNAGPEPTDAFRSNINVNGVFECGNNFPVGANTSWVTSCDTAIVWPADAACLTGQLDHLNVIRESNEINNNLSLQDITVARPMAGATWSVGSGQTVMWSSCNLLPGNVNIRLSTNGGSTFPITLRSNTPNDGTESITVPNNLSNLCRVRVESVNNPEVFGDNPGNFGIISSPAILTVNPLVLDFSAVQGGQNPAAKTFNITNTGTGTMNWTVADDQPWLSASPTSGSTTTETDQVTVSINIAGLAAGSYTGNITVTAPDANNSPRVVRVNLTIVQPPVGCQDPQTCPGAAIFPVREGGTTIGEPIVGANGTTVCIDVRLKQNAQPIDAFGFRMQVDPSRLAFVNASAGNLTTGFQNVNAQEAPAGSGMVTCGGFGTTPIPANSNGVLIRLCFRVTCQDAQQSAILLSNPIDDLAGFGTCCNIFTCQPCVKDGDINADNLLSPADALCAFQIFINNGTVPSGCNVAGFDCEVLASDVNCDNTTTPADALAIFSRFLAGGAPAECFARTAIAARAVQSGPYEISWNTLAVVKDAASAERELVKLSLRVGNPAGLQAFGLRLQYPASRLTLLGVQRASLTAEWLQLEGQTHEPGAVMIGGYHSKPVNGTASDEVLQVIFASHGEAVQPADFSVSELVDDFEAALVQGGAHVQEESAAIPHAFKLHQSFPNPFKTGASFHETIIRFDLAGGESMPVELAVYNVAGQLVRQLLIGQRSPGAYEVAWDGKNEQGQPAPSGTYLYRIKAGNWTESKQLTVVR